MVVNIEKRSLRTTRKATSNLFIYNLLKQGLRPSQISSDYNINKHTIQTYLSSLKQEGYIKKVGYGTWEIIKEFNETSLSKTTRLGLINPQSLQTSFKSDSVRGHAFQFTFSIPKNFRNWDKRKQILDRLQIPYKELGVFGGGEQLDFKGRKVWLTNKSIIIFEKSSYMAETSKEAKSYAINDALELIKALEKHLQANMGTYRFKVSRQHYSLIKNALAKQYDKEGKKLQIYNDSGLWFLIDNSFNLHEAETVHPKTSDIDNRPVQDWFNGLKTMNGFTPQFVVNTLYTQTKNLDDYAIHLKAHVESVKELGKQSKVNSESVIKLSSAVEELVKVVKELKEK